MYKFVVISSGMMFIPSFKKICQLIQML